MKRAIIVLLLLAVFLSFTACAPSEVSFDGFSMGAYVTVNYQGKSNYKNDILQLLDKIEESYSAAIESSPVAKLNKANAGELIHFDSEEVELLQYAFSIATLTENAYNPAIYPLVKLWGFNPPYLMNGKVPPSVQSIDEAKQLSSITYFNILNNGVQKINSLAMIDLGGIAKGYAAEKAIDYLSLKGIDTALVIIGKSAIARLGKSIRIGISAPRDSKYSYAVSFSLSNNEICATSGDYERYFELDGVRYHHIIDSATGNPAASGVISATVVSSNGALSDALATAAIVLGVEKASEIIAKQGQSWRPHPQTPRLCCGGTESNGCPRRIH